MVYIHQDYPLVDGIKLGQISPNKARTSNVPKILRELEKSTLIQLGAKRISYTDTEEKYVVNP